jgi:hypothetical protein
MLAKVFHRSREYFVLLTDPGLGFEDEAGPFDDECDAVLMARRSVGAENVRFLYGPSDVPMDPALEALTNFSAYREAA